MTKRLYNVRLPNPQYRQITKSLRAAEFSVEAKHRVFLWHAQKADDPNNFESFFSIAHKKNSQKNVEALVFTGIVHKFSKY